MDLMCLSFIHTILNNDSQHMRSQGKAPFNSQTKETKETSQSKVKEMKQTMKNYKQLFSDINSHALISDQVIHSLPSEFSALLRFYEKIKPAVRKFWMNLEKSQNELNAGFWERLFRYIEQLTLKSEKERNQSKQKLSKVSKYLLRIKQGRDLDCIKQSLKNNAEISNVLIQTIKDYEQLKKAIKMLQVLVPNENQESHLTQKLAFLVNSIYKKIIDHTAFLQEQKIRPFLLDSVLQNKQIPQNDSNDKNHNCFKDHVENKQVASEKIKLQEKILQGQKKSEQLIIKLKKYEQLKKKIQTFVEKKIQWDTKTMNEVKNVLAQIDFSNKTRQIIQVAHSRNEKNSQQLIIEEVQTTSIIQKVEKENKREQMCLQKQKLYLSEKEKLEMILLMKNKELAQLQEKIKLKRQQYGKQSRKIIEMQDKLANITQKCINHQKSMEMREKEIKSKQQEIQAVQEKMKTKREMEEELSKLERSKLFQKEYLDGIEKDIKQKKDQYEQKKGEFQKRIEDLARKEEELKKKVDECQKDKVEKLNEIDKLKKTKDDLNQKLRERQNELSKINRQIENKTNQIKKKLSECEERQKELEEKQKSVQQHCLQKLKKLNNTLQHQLDFNQKQKKFKQKESYLKAQYEIQEEKEIRQNKRQSQLCELQHLFAQSKFYPEILQNFQEQRNFLLKQIQKLNENLLIKRTRLLYSFPRFKQCQFHSLVDGYHDYVVIIQLENKMKIAAYSKEPLQKGQENKGPGFIASLTNKEVFFLKKIQKAKLTVYNDFYLKFGNSELLIKLSGSKPGQLKQEELKVKSNFGESNSNDFFSRHFKDQTIIFGECTKETKMLQYEIFQVIFEE